MEFKVGDKVKIHAPGLWGDGVTGQIQRHDGTFYNVVGVKRQGGGLVDFPARESELVAIPAANPRYKVTHTFDNAQDALDFMVVHGGTVSPA